MLHCLSGAVARWAFQGKSNIFCYTYQYTWGREKSDTEDVVQYHISVE